MAGKQGAPSLAPEQAERVRAGMMELKRRHGWNNAELGKQLGMTTGSAISQSLGLVPKNRPSFPTTVQVARLLGQDVMDLLMHGPEPVLPNALPSARQVLRAHRLRGTPDDVTTDVLEGLAERFGRDLGFDFMFDAVRQEHEARKRAAPRAPLNETEQKLLRQTAAETPPTPKRAKPDGSVKP